jgi:AcrR family transcriptional regulator
MANKTAPRLPLTREKILQAAVDLADKAGLDALTMRQLGGELGVEAMSLYKHVSNKDEILDGMIELVVGQIEIPSSDAEWREAMRQRAVSARAVLRRHSWAIGLFEARSSTGPTVVSYLNAVLGSLRSAGFSIEQAAHAFWLLDCYVYGHVIQETSIPVNSPEESPASQEVVLEQITTDELPHLIELEKHALTSKFSFDGEFQFGLDLILDGLDRLRDVAT